MTSLLMLVSAIGYCEFAMQDRPTWADTYLSTWAKPVVAVERRQVPLQSGEGSGKTIEGRVSFASAESRKKTEQANKVLDYIAYLLRNGKTSSASEYAKRVMREQPQITEAAIVDRLVDVEILMGRFASAEGILQREFQRNPDGNEQMFLQLSILLAKKGATQVGQAEYCRERTEDRMRWDQGLEWNLKSLLLPLQKLHHPSVFTESCIAIGMASRPEYFELVLKWDPKNQFAAAKLFDSYISRGLYSEARRIEKIGSLSATSEMVKKRYRRVLGLIEGQADKPVDRLMSEPDLRGDPPNP